MNNDNKKTRKRSPIAPRNAKDPTGAERIARGAENVFDKKISNIKAFVKNELDKLAVTNVANEKRYVFLLDENTLNNLFSDIDLYVDNQVEGEQDDNDWFFNEYVKKAYERGTKQEITNLAYQSALYEQSRSSLSAIIQSDPYRRRQALVRARVLEEVKGLSADIKKNITRVLSDGIGQGEGTREIARRVEGQLGVERSRASRIARTEVLTALRRGRMDETQEAEFSLGFETRQVHISALSPTTRKSHADRHGKVFTIKEQQDWWSKDANAINCKCSTITVLTDSKGKPLLPEFEKRLRDKYSKIAKQENYDWAQAA